MTDEAEKTAAEQQKKIGRTVSTGAWWKSAGQDKAAAQEEQAAAAEQAPASAEEGSGTENDAAAEQLPDAVPPQKKERRTRSRRKKSSRRSTTAEQQNEPKTAEQEEEDRAAAAETASVPAEEGSGTENDAATEQPPDAAAPSKKKEQRTRSRRKKSSRRSTTAEQQDAPKPEEHEEDDEEIILEEEAALPANNGKKVVAKLLINAEEPEECRIALVENGRLEFFHVSTLARERTKNNIYKGRIVSIEPSLQAAFIDIGGGRNGFLPFSDIHPEYYKEDLSEQSRKLIREQQWRRLKIEDVVSRGQEVLVQVVKEATGSKGANMTTYLSLPGRCLVLMPGSDSSGISRKISGESRRSELREMVSGLSIPEGIGYIVRTASAEITPIALQEDCIYLLGLWEEIRQRGQNSPAPALIYEEQETVLRFLRDCFVPETDEIIVDTQESYDQVVTFVASLPARQKKVQIKLHRGAKPIFNQYSLEEQIESIYQPQVPLPSGGSIVINPTEALVAIDVNSGRTSEKGDFDKSIFLANMEAAEELARQLRLRDLGGLIVVDFIDMRNRSHIKEVEKQVKLAMKRDKAKVDISRISRFGLMQISRQKMGTPIERGSYHRCAHCEGRGVVRSVETLALYYLRRIQTGVSRKKVSQVQAQLPLEVGQYLLNRKRAEIMELESRHQASIEIIPLPEMKPGENKIEFLA